DVLFCESGGCYYTGFDINHVEMEDAMADWITNVKRHFGVGSENARTNKPSYTGFSGDVDPRTEAREREANLSRGAGGGFGGGNSAAPPTGFSVPGATPGGTQSDFTPTRTSPGGSMVLGKDNLGVE